MLPLLLTKAEAAEALRATEAEVDELTTSGFLSTIRLTETGEVRYRPEDLLGVINRVEAAERERSARRFVEGWDPTRPT